MRDITIPVANIAIKLIVAMFVPTWSLSIFIAWVWLW